MTPTPRSRSRRRRRPTRQWRRSAPPFDWAKGQRLSRHRGASRPFQRPGPPRPPGLGDAGRPCETKSEGSPPASSGVSASRNCSIFRWRRRCYPWGHLSGKHAPKATNWNQEKRRCRFANDWRIWAPTISWTARSPSKRKPNGNRYSPEKVTCVPPSTGFSDQVVTDLTWLVDRETKRRGGSNSTISSSVSTKKTQESTLGANACPAPAHWPRQKVKPSESFQPGQRVTIVGDRVEYRVDWSRDDCRFSHRCHQLFVRPPNHAVGTSWPPVRSSHTSSPSSSSTQSRIGQPRAGASLAGKTRLTSIR